MSNQPSRWNPASVVMNIGFVRGFIEQARLSWELFRDPRVPRWTKLIPILTIVYLVSPVDWLVNMVPVLGQMEDIAVLGLCMNIFIRLSPADIVNEHLAQLRADH